MVEPITLVLPRINFCPLDTLVAHFVVFRLFRFSLVGRAVRWLLSGIAATESIDRFLGVRGPRLPTREGWSVGRSERERERERERKAP